MLSLIKKHERSVEPFESYRWCHTRYKARRFTNVWKTNGLHDDKRKRWKLQDREQLTRKKNERIIFQNSKIFVNRNHWKIKSVRKSRWTRLHLLNNLFAFGLVVLHNFVSYFFFSLFFSFFTFLNSWRIIWMQYVT